MLRTEQIKGHIALLIANLFWGVMSPISKSILLGGQISPIALSAIRIGGGALLFAICSVILPPSIAPRERVQRNDWWKIAIASVLMISANQGLYILGIGYTSPIDSAVMSSITPVITMVLAAVILRYPITGLKFLGVMLGLVGVVLLVTAGNEARIASNVLLGDSLCLGAQFCAAIYYVAFSGLTRRYAPFTLMKLMFYISALTYVPCCITELVKVPYSSLPASTWASLSYIIIFATCISYLTLPYAQRILKPTVISVYNYFQPLFAAVVAVWLGIGEFGVTKIAATILIFVGVYFVNNNSKGSRRSE